MIHYNLQMIIAVGFKVSNERAVQFRKWSNGIVKDFTIKGWVMDDERLKTGGPVLTEDYFQRLLQRPLKLHFAPVLESDIGRGKTRIAEINGRA